MKLDQSTIEKLGYYVYLLRDPRTHETFYVGKGKGNRINQHKLEALVDGNDKSAKIKKINNILGDSDIELVILRHGISSEEQAYEIEAAAIDLLGRDTLTNIMGGHHSDNRGITSLHDLKIKYESKEVVVTDNLALVQVREYSNSDDPEVLYDRARYAWTMGLKTVEQIDYICAVHKGIVREVYGSLKWHKAQEFTHRLYFEGELAPDSVRRHYIDTRVGHYFKNFAQAFTYVWGNK